jgi:hypothetical protein
MLTPRQKLSRKIYHRAWEERNRAEVTRKRRIWAKENKQAIQKRQRDWCAANREHLRKYLAARRTRLRAKLRDYLALWRKNNYVRDQKTRSLWRRRNRDRLNPIFSARKKERYATEEQFRAMVILRARLSSIFRTKGIRRSARTEALLGADFRFVKNYLEKLFSPGMTWLNRGKHSWHVDHIRPCSSFDLTDPEQQKLCFHYTNLQPLWAVDNLRKSDKWSPPM